MEHILENLFESVPKVRILRLFMRNQENYFSFEEVRERSQISHHLVQRELGKLMKIGLVYKKTVTVRKEINPQRKKKRIRARKLTVYAVNPKFEFLSELRDLIARATVASRTKILKKMKGLGRVKLAISAGILINKETPRIDLLVVGEKIKKRKFDQLLVDLESELGKTLRYALMDTDEFKYRRNMYDRFIRDILEYPHEKLINKLNI